MVNAVYILKCSNSQDRLNLMDVLTMICSRVQNLPGCVQSNIWKNQEETEVMVFDVWRSKKDFESHVRSMLFKRLLAALEMSSAPPRVRISECAEIKGLELIEELLSMNEKM